LSPNLIFIPTAAASTPHYLSLHYSNIVRLAIALAMGSVLGFCVVISFLPTPCRNIQHTKVTQMLKSKTALISTLIIAGLFGGVFISASPILGALGAIALAGYMYHFRTLTNDWTNAETWANAPLAFFAIVSFLGSSRFPICSAVFLDLGAAFVGIYMTGFVAMLMRRRGA